MSRSFSKENLSHECTLDSPLYNETRSKRRSSFHSALSVYSDAVENVIDEPIRRACRTDKETMKFLRDKWDDLKYTLRGYVIPILQQNTGSEGIDRRQIDEEIYSVIQVVVSIFRDNEKTQLIRRREIEEIIDPIEFDEERYFNDPNRISQRTWPVSSPVTDEAARIVPGDASDDEPMSIPEDMTDDELMAVIEEVLREQDIPEIPRSATDRMHIYDSAEDRTVHPVDLDLSSTDDEEDHLTDYSEFMRTVRTTTTTTPRPTRPLSIGYPVPRDEEERRFLERVREKQSRGRLSEIFGSRPCPTPRQRSPVVTALPTIHPVTPLEVTPTISAESLPNQETPATVAEPCPIQPGQSVIESRAIDPDPCPIQPERPITPRLESPVIRTEPCPIQPERPITPRLGSPVIGTESRSIQPERPITPRLESPRTDTEPCPIQTERPITFRSESPLIDIEPCPMQPARPVTPRLEGPLIDIEPCPIQPTRRPLQTPLSTLPSPIYPVQSVIPAHGTPLRSQQADPTFAPINAAQRRRLPTIREERSPYYPPSSSIPERLSGARNLEDLFRTDETPVAIPGPTQPRRISASRADQPRSSIGDRRSSSFLEQQGHYATDRESLPSSVGEQRRYTTDRHPLPSAPTQQRQSLTGRRIPQRTSTCPPCVPVSQQRATIHPHHASTLRQPTPAHSRPTYPQCAAPASSQRTPTYTQHDTPVHQQRTPAYAPQNPVYSPRAPICPVRTACPMRSVCPRLSTITTSAPARQAEPAVNDLLDLEDDIGSPSFLQSEPRTIVPRERPRRDSRPESTELPGITPSRRSTGEQPRRLLQGSDRGHSEGPDDEETERHDPRPAGQARTSQQHRVHSEIESETGSILIDDSLSGTDSNNNGSRRQVCPRRRMSVGSDRRIESESDSILVDDSASEASSNRRSQRRRTCPRRNDRNDSTQLRILSVPKTQKRSTISKIPKEIARDKKKANSVRSPKNSRNCKTENDNQLQSSATHYSRSASTESDPSCPKMDAAQFSNSNLNYVQFLKRNRLTADNGRLLDRNKKIKNKK